MGGAIVYPLASISESPSYRNITLSEKIYWICPNSSVNVVVLYKKMSSSQYTWKCHCTSHIAHLSIQNSLHVTKRMMHKGLSGNRYSNFWVGEWVMFSFSETGRISSRARVDSNGHFLDGYTRAREFSRFVRLYADEWAIQVKKLEASKTGILSIREHWKLLALPLTWLLLACPCPRNTSGSPSWSRGSVQDGSPQHCDRKKKFQLICHLQFTPILSFEQGMAILENWMVNWKLLRVIAVSHALPAVRKLGRAEWITGGRKERQEGDIVWYGMVWYGMVWYGMVSVW